MLPLYRVMGLIAMLVLCGCDPMYRFKYTRFAPRSPALNGPETRVTQVNEEGLRTITVERDGIIVKPNGGGNSLNHEWMRIAITNNTDSRLLVGAEDVRVLNPNTPSHLIANLTRGSDVPIKKVELEPNAGNDERFAVAPHSTSELGIDLGIRGGAKYAIEIALTRADSQTRYVYRFRTAAE